MPRKRAARMEGYNRQQHQQHPQHAFPTTGMAPTFVAPDGAPHERIVHMLERLDGRFTGLEAKFDQMQRNLVRMEGKAKVRHADVLRQATSAAGHAARCARYQQDGRDGGGGGAQHQRESPHESDDAADQRLGDLGERVGRLAERLERVETRLRKRWANPPSPLSSEIVFA